MKRYPVVFYITRDQPLSRARDRGRTQFFRVSSRFLARVCSVGVESGLILETRLSRRTRWRYLGHDQVAINIARPDSAKPTSNSQTTPFALRNGNRYCRRSRGPPRRPLSPLGDSESPIEMPNASPSRRRRRTHTPARDFTSRLVILRPLRRAAAMLLHFRSIEARREPRYLCSHGSHTYVYVYVYVWNLFFFSLSSFPPPSPAPYLPRQSCSFDRARGCVEAIWKRSQLVDFRRVSVCLCDYLVGIREEAAAYLSRKMGTAVPSEGLVSEAGTYIRAAV